MEEKAAAKPENDGLVDSNGEELPRFKLKVQDDVTGIVMAVGTDDLKAFARDDLKKFLRQFRHNVEVANQQRLQKAEAWAAHEAQYKNRKSIEPGEA